MEARYSEGMDKRTALNYLEIFDDAVYIEKIKGFRAGRRINKKSGDRMAYFRIHYENALKELKEIETCFAKVQEKLENDLASIYIQSIKDAATISRLCDQRLDKSGAMLGRVRNIAAALAIIEREEAEGKR